MTVTMLVENIGDVAISASMVIVCVNVATQHSVINKSSATIAAPAPAAHRAETLSHVPEVRCGTSQSSVRMEAATVITT